MELRLLRRGDISVGSGRMSRSWLGAEAERGPRQSKCVNKGARSCRCVVFAQWCVAGAQKGSEIMKTHLSET